MPFDKNRMPAFGRRQLLAAGLSGAGLLAAPALAARSVSLHLPGGPSMRPMTSAFPEKGEMILQRSRPPLLETPMQVFDEHLFTPNNRFFVRWHWADIPTAVDVNRFRLNISGAVRKPLSLTLADLLRMPRMEIAAVNQCSGNSRGFFTPRVPGAQWGNGAMGNARWEGVSLRHVLDLAGVEPGADAVRFGGLDSPVVPDGPDFEKSLEVDHARDGEVMLAFGMNGESLPLLNGFPLRLIVPGWYSTYWMKALNTIEVLKAPDENFWMAKAYRIPTTPYASVAPGSSGYPTIPINHMVPRSWITNIADGATLPLTPRLAVRGIAMGGDKGVASVALSQDGGKSWQEADLGPDFGTYSFRRFTGSIRLEAPGPLTLMVRCTNTDGTSQPLAANWNPSGFMRGKVESTRMEIRPA